MKEPKDWITINGQHVPIFEGENKREATSKFLNKKMSRVAKNKDKYETIDTFKKRKATNKLDNDKKIRLVKDKDNRYIVSRGESDEEAIENYKRNYGDEKERNEEEPSRREKLIKYTQENKEKIAQYGREYNEETNRQAFEKAKQKEGLSAKEYFGFIASKERPGDIITDVTADGEDVIVAKDGKWVRKSRIKEYNNNPSANKDAIVDIEEEERKMDEREYYKTKDKDYDLKNKDYAKRFVDDHLKNKEYWKKFGWDENPTKETMYDNVKQFAYVSKEDFDKIYNEAKAKYDEKERIEEFKRRKRTNK